MNENEPSWAFVKVKMNVQRSWTFKNIGYTWPKLSLEKRNCHKKVKYLNSKPHLIYDRQHK